MTSGTLEGKGGGGSLHPNWVTPVHPPPVLPKDGAPSLGPPSPSSIPFLTRVSLSPSPLPLLHHPGSVLHSLSIIPPVVCHHVQHSASHRSSAPPTVPPVLRSSRGMTVSAPSKRGVHTATLCLSRPSPPSLVHTCSSQMKRATSASSRCVLHKATVAPCD